MYCLESIFYDNGINLEQFVDLDKFDVNIRKIWFECKILISGTLSGKSITVKGILSLLMSVSTIFYTLEIRNYLIILKNKISGEFGEISAVIIQS